LPWQRCAPPPLRLRAARGFLDLTDRRALARSDEQGYVNLSSMERRGWMRMVLPIPIKVREDKRLFDWADGGPRVGSSRGIRCERRGGRWWQRGIPRTTAVCTPLG
jgi:hypothetical protein